MDISIVGAGYVGLVTGISLSKLGHKVICIDEDISKVKIIESGKAHFFEPGIDGVLKEVLKSGHFSVTTDFEKAILESSITLVAVGTPTVNNKIDLSFVTKASEQIGLALAKSNKYHVITIKSTVLPGVTEEVVKPILEKYSNKKIGEFGLCMNPEFLREGCALEDALHPDRIIIGQIDDRSGKEFAKVYKKIATPKIFTNLATAEMTKYAANALFATLISFSSEIARIAETTKGVDVIDVWRGVHLDKRLNPIQGKVRVEPGVLGYIFSGCGFGGSCFPKDTKALAAYAEGIGVEPKLIKSVIDINNTQPQRVIIQLKNVIPVLRNKNITVLGISFKPGTDDIRESPAIPIIEELLLEGANVTGHDPMVYERNIPKLLKDLDIKLAKNIKEAVNGADAVILVTSWAEYVSLSPKFFKQHMKQPIIIDGRRIYDKISFIRAGMIYKGIGLWN